MPRLSFKDFLYLSLGLLIILVINVTVGHLWRDAYLTYSIDTWLHFIAGVSIAITSLYWLEKFEHSGKLIIKNRALRILVVVSFVMATALAWEMIEFTSDTFFGSNTQPSNADTMKDMIWGTLGGFVWTVWALRKK